ncbi:MAG TPA: hypothetical protein VF635_01325 [Propionibacteriaceae bacterium]
MTSSSLNQHQHQLSKAFAHAELTVNELWLRHFALGGDAAPLELDAYLNALMPLTEHEHNILAVAINERLTEIGQPHAPYYEPPSLTRSQPGS